MSSQNKAPGFTDRGAADETIIIISWKQSCVCTRGVATYLTCGPESEERFDAASVR